MITILSPPQLSNAAFPKNTVHVENYHLDGLVVGCGREHEQPDFRSINNGEEYLLEFNDTGTRLCTFNWNAKHTTFPVFNHALSDRCSGGSMPECWWRAMEKEFQFLEEDWVTMHYW
ncbi:hypothetical protein QVD17_25130 [Tagetes erecta]|uniref:S-protein homolog n=1 Tax=Tagetes erecta TaxID=13708 RepID=A0AAD8KGC8_TARER|nr:hypothetical protein QVD17_25130 [Tagetes erecta]